MGMDVGQRKKKKRRGHRLKPMPRNPRSFRATNLIGSFQDDGGKEGDERSDLEDPSFLRASMGTSVGRRKKEKKKQVPRSSG
jgi:hypothetical protein